MGSLQTFGDNPRYSMIEQNHDDTLHWIWLSRERGGPSLCEWLGDEEGLFLISGKPGAGKSTLCKHLESCDTTMDLFQPQSSRRTIIISFFFWDLGLPSEKTFSGLLHNFLWQLLSQIPELMPTVLARFQRLRKHSSSLSRSSSIWNESELQSAVKDVLKIKVSDTTVLWLIDGLDECENKSIKQMLEFLAAFSTLNSPSSLKFKILCSARPANFIDITFSKFPRLRLQEYTWQDIEDFLNLRIQTLTKNLPTDERRDRIIAEIVPEVVGKAEGVFMYASIVAEDIVSMIAAGCEEELYQKIQELPAELEFLYASIIAKIPRHHRHHTYNYLQLHILANHGYSKPDNLLGITLASYPPDQVLKAPSENDKWSNEKKIAACHRMKRILRDTCAGLVNLPHFDPAWSEEEKITRFCRGEVYVHKTVKDYLFNGDSPTKVWSGIDKSLLISSYLQRVSYCFHLLKVDSATRLQAVPRPTWVRRKEESVVVLVLHLFLDAVARGEEYGKLSLSVVWISAAEEMLKVKSSSQKEVVDFYDAASVVGKSNIWPSVPDIAN